MQDVEVKFAYKAGFRRLWLALSLLWLIGAVLVVSEYREGALQAFLLFGFLPVIAIYVIGVALVWIIEGFARADR
ncbi:hypothetical protein ACI2KS_10375 [Pseudomonas sp. NPDC087358]|uniref:hypothetical protein n=1 Tax=Pseudomonas sp. NPDC087358 TaxID=3364439 RepID=UPI00384EEC84